MKVFGDQKSQYLRTMLEMREEFRTIIFLIYFNNFEVSGAANSKEKLVGNRCQEGFEQERPLKMNFP